MVSHVHNGDPSYMILANYTNIKMLWFCDENLCYVKYILIAFRWTWLIIIWII